MDENKLSKEWLEKNGDKLKTVYSFAVVNKLEIKSSKNVLQILKKVDSKNDNDNKQRFYSKTFELFKISLERQ